MGYKGTQGGIRIYDLLEDVPRQIVESGQRFIILDPPQELLESGSETYTYNSPITLFHLIGYAILITIVGKVMITVLQQIGYIFQGRPGQKVDDNLFEGGDGSVWVRDPRTGEWRKAKGARIDMMVWAIVAIGLITIAILIFFAYKKKGR